MCGIVGFSGNFPDSLFFNALQALDHRGPDDSGYFFSDTHPIALGHTRLSILDLLHWVINQCSALVVKSP